MRYAIGACFDGRYEIQSLLGEGGMAEVYSALDANTGRQVVLKLPQAAVAGDLASYNRFKREMNIGNRLDHPGLQRLLSDEKSPYMVLEYVDGVSLRQYFRAHRPLPIEQVLDMGSQLAETLEYVHSQGIVHRDLKPENILIQPDGKLRLMDFGIALRLDARRLTFSHLTNAVGTPDYMAPEQVRGERGDARTDVYALGVMLYELLTGSVPYPTDDALRSMRRKVENEPPLVRRARPEVPEPVQAIVYRAMRRRPDERYASMAELAGDLNHLDRVTIPRYVVDVPAPAPLGDLPPWRTSLPIFAAILCVLAILGFLAQTLHHSLPPR